MRDDKTGIREGLLWYVCLFNGCFLCVSSNRSNVWACSCAESWLGFTTAWILADKCWEKTASNMDASWGDGGGTFICMLSSSQTSFKNEQFHLLSSWIITASIVGLMGKKKCFKTRKKERKKKISSCFFYYTVYTHTLIPIMWFPMFKGFITSSARLHDDSLPYHRLQSSFDTLDTPHDAPEYPSVRCWHPQAHVEVVVVGTWCCYY